jgi:DNA invertase Pin-like site-specific DNA recombinase
MIGRPRKQYILGTKTEKAEPLLTIPKNLVEQFINDEINKEKIRNDKIKLENYCEDIKSSLLLEYDLDSIYDDTKMKCIGYCRVSTELQKETGFSIVTQIKSTEEYCKLNNCILIATYIDNGISGRDEKLTKRIAYGAMKKYITSKIHKIIPYKLGIIVGSFNRISREVIEQERFIKEFLVINRLNLTLLDSLTTNIYDNSGKLILNVIGAFAEYESNCAKSSAKLNLRMKVELNDLKGRNRYGWDNNDNPIPEEQEGLLMIHRLHDDGKTNAEIFDIMNSEIIDENGVGKVIPYVNRMITIKKTGIVKPKRILKNQELENIWTRAVISSIIERYINSKRDVKPNLFVMSKDKIIEEHAVRIYLGNPSLTYVDIAKKINEMCIYNAIIKPHHISKILRINTTNTTVEHIEHIENNKLIPLHELLNISEDQINQELVEYYNYKLEKLPTNRITDKEFTIYTLVMAVKNKFPLFSSYKIGNKLHKLGVPSPGNKSLSWHVTDANRLMAKANKNTDSNELYQQNIRADIKEEVKEEIKEEVTEKLIQDIEGKLTIELQARFTEMENKLREYEEKFKNLELKTSKQK